MSAAPEASRVAELLREAAWWRLLALLFECPGEEWRRDVAALARDVDDAGLRAAAATALETATEGQYHSVFGPGGPAPPREASYHDTVELGTLMGTLAGYHQAFNYRPDSCEPPDHVAVELDFLAYLRFKEAYAMAAGDAEHAAVTAEAAGRLTAEHIAMIAAPLASLLAGSGIDYLMLASALLAARVGPRPVRARLTVLPESSDDDGSLFSCSEQ